MTKQSLFVLAVLVGGCSSTAKPQSAADGSRGGALGSGGLAGASGSVGTGGAAGAGGTTSSRGVTGTGGSQADAAADARSDGATETGGRSNTGGAAGASGGMGTGGTSVIGPDGGRDSGGDAKLDLRSDTTSEGGGVIKLDAAGDAAGVSDTTTRDGAACPYTGHVTYTLAKSSSPTTDDQAAYAKITAAMDQAIAYYNCYTNITKAEKVEYDSSVATADGNSNGTIRFGSSTDYMVLPTAMHEIAHTVGIGTASNWRSFVAIPDGGSSGPWTGANGIAQRQALLPDDYEDQKVLTADTQHFWPYGLNYASEYKSEADLLGHCAMVMAMRKDMGLQ